MKIHLREWQREAFALYSEQLENGARSMLWEATPGAGKTTAALRVVLHQLSTKKANKVLIVVPTSHLKTQWAQSAARFDLHLDSNFMGGRKKLTEDFHGAVVTYQQFGGQGALFRKLASESVVILDEVHHAGDGLAWGVAIKKELQEARFILCLSGTAFRSDMNPIPFVTYDKDGSSQPDYCYGYSKAVSDGVCRPTAVFTYGGEVSWAEKDRVLTTSFADALDGNVAARRLRAALTPAAGWIQPMIKDAHQMLLALRQKDPRAGGLIVCADRTHAREMAKLVTEMSGFRPTVVLSDDAGASKKIKQFTESTEPWIIACNMVSEGVDIPRLQVGVYATTIRTKMYFRQFLGRIVRTQAGSKKMEIAYLYLPADSYLQFLAHEIEEEVRHIISNKDSEQFEDDRERKRDTEKEPQAWTVVQGINSGVDSIIVHGNQLSLFGNNAAPDQVQAAIQAELSIHRQEKLTRSELKAQMGNEIKRLVGLLHHKTKKSHSAIHAEVNKAQKVSSQTRCTEAQLQQRITIIREMLEKAPLSRRAA